MKTYLPKVDELNPNWLVIDAQDQILGKVATRVASLLRGKHKPNFTPHLKTGDHVIVINAEKVAVTGNKMTDKMYYRYSGYRGGLKVTPLKVLLAKHPERVIEFAVKGMLPKTILGRHTLRNLHVYVGPDHPHTAQKPATVAVDSRTSK